MATATVSWTPVLRPRAPRSLQGRLLLTYLALVALGLGALILWAGQRLQAAAVEQAGHDLVLQSQLLASALREPLEEAGERRGGRGRPLEGLLQQYAESTGSRVTLLDARGRVVASSDGRVPVGTTLSGPEITAAQQGRQDHDIRQDPWAGDERVFAAAPVLEDERRAAGLVQLAAPMGPLRARIWETWLSLAGAGGAVLLATALASVWLARQIAGPIGDLTRASEQLAAGQLDRRVEPAGVDEIRRLGQAFNRMAERLEEMLARQRAFVAHAAHELRSPLTGIGLRLEMLREHGQADPERARRYLAEVEREVDHLRRLVDHLLALSSLDEGKRPPRAPLDLAPLLYELADEIGPLVRAAGLALRVEVPPHLPAVAANAEQMRMVARNLLDNAVAYTPAGGTVTLSAEAGEGEVRIRVADTGVGIPAEALPRVFERFYRVDEARSRREGGVGLGLALVRDVVEAHGGRVEAASQPGAGSVFTVHLPLSGPSTRPAPPPSARAPAPTIRAR